MLPAGLAGELQEIRDDRVHGAMTLARRAAAALLAHAGELAPESVPALAAEIASAQPLMAPFLHLARRLRERQDVAAVCRDFLHQIDHADEHIFRHLLPLLPPDSVILTHSYSRTVEHALLRLHSEGRTARVIVTESRPLSEGVQLASSLAAAGVPVDLIVDAAAGLMIEEAGTVLTGADWISPSVVVNKIGTRLIVLAARQSRKAVYALASELKISPAGLPPPVEQPKHPAEVGTAPGCRVRNYYFEPTPREWFTAVITEHGLTPAAASPVPQTPPRAR
jgi:translation initiation factor 2B subunit (eIF-2B alpha/beta/delta family)